METTSLLITGHLIMVVARMEVARTTDLLPLLVSTPRVITEARTAALIVGSISISILTVDLTDMATTVQEARARTVHPAVLILIKRSNVRLGDILDCALPPR
jgi:hypothetical protein